MFEQQQVQDHYKGGCGADGKVSGGGMGTVNPMASLFYYIFTYLFLAVLGLHHCVQAFSNCGEWCTGFLLPWILLLQSLGSRVKAQ